jgi:hypothetical protein
LLKNPPREPLLARNNIPSNEVDMKRERLTQIVLVIVGLLNLAQIYFLYMDLRHSSWLLERKSEVHPMFLSFFIPVGVFLLMAARRPSEHRSMIALAAWWHISHGLVMAIQTVEAWNHNVHRNFTDVILFLAIGAVLLALLPAKREAGAPGVA